MNRLILIAPLAAALSTPSTAAETTALPPIDKIEIRNGAFYVNEQPFFPIMIWLQQAGDFEAARRCGINTVAGYWTGSSGTKDVAEYLDLVAKAGFYGVMPFDQRLKGRPDLLGYIHEDEPDLPHQVSDAEVAAGEGLRVNSSTPLWKIVDGVTHSWSVLDPMAGAEITIRLRQPVTVVRLVVWPTISEGLAVPKDVSFTAEGKEIARATLENKKGSQSLPLAKPATFSELKLTVHSAYPGKQPWGSLGEIEGYDSSGNNVLLSPPRHEPRALPAESLRAYETMKAGDPSRPVFMTLTGHFHPHFDKWSEEQRTSLYPAYLRATDVVGYDIYPIYGWNKPEWIHLVQEATGQLVAMAGGKPVYAWIETSKGSQWTGALERQRDVKPEHIRAEVWMALCRGATAIGYFTHIWKPSYSPFGVPEENRRALGEINGQITRLTPVLLAPAARQAVRVSADAEARVDFMAREHEGALYVFAVNYDPRALDSKVTVAVPGLRRGAKVEVIDEQRSIEAAEGSFTDHFKPFGVHLYRFEPAPGA